jgi:hypothetical protein
VSSVSPTPRSLLEKSAAAGAVPHPVLARLARTQGVQELPGVTQTEMQWANDHVLTLLRGAMRASANEHGWQFVDGVNSHFEGHGYCAAEPWLVRLQQTFEIQGGKDGALHPNVAGHEAYAAAIVDAFDSAQ